MRCFGDGNPLYERYHDEEWGLPVRDEQGLFERISLEAFQSGLAWITICASARASGAPSPGSIPKSLPHSGEKDVARLLADVEIVRNRAKIEATIANARATLALRETETPLHELIWAFAPPPRSRRPTSWDEVPAQTAESKALAKALKAAGFRFVGPTTAYAAMQACGLVDDHLAGCRSVS